VHLALPRRAEGCCGDGRFALGRDTQYSALSIKCADRLQLLFNGEYFIQNANWRELRSSSPRVDADSPAYPEFLELAKAEGPPYQYGSGCLSDGLLGAWFGLVCGLGDLMDLEKVESHLLAVHRNNFKRSLFRHANTKRPHFACVQRTRPPHVHMASGRQAITRNDLCGRGLDRSGASSRLSPYRSRKNSGRSGNCPGMQNSVRWPCSQPI